MKYKWLIVIGVIVSLFGLSVGISNKKSTHVTAIDTVYYSDIQKHKCDSLYCIYIEDFTAYNASIFYKEDEWFIQQMYDRYYNDSLLVMKELSKYYNYLNSKQIYSITYIDKKGNKYVDLY